MQAANGVGGAGGKPQQNGGENVGIEWGYE